jgi:hypothetical protein
MPRTRVPLPPQVREPFEVYLNGVAQERGRDYVVEGRDLVFDRELQKDHVSGWRWLIGSFGFSTYRQDDSVDVRYVRADGTQGVAERLELVPDTQGGGGDTSPA